MLQRDMHAFVPFLAVLVMPCSMAMEKRAALRVLPAQSDRITFGEQRGISQSFCHTPIQRLLTTPHRDAIIDDFLHACMQGKIIRHASERKGELLYALQWHGGIYRNIPWRDALARCPVDGN